MGVLQLIILVSLGFATSELARANEPAPLPPAAGTLVTQTDPSEVQKTFTPYLTLSVGQNLTPEDRRTSVTFEPEMAVRLGKTSILNFYTLLDRPTNLYEELAIAKVLTTLHQEVDLTPLVKTKLIFGVNALNLHRWKYDGYAVRGSVALHADKELLSNLTLGFRVTPYVQANEYTQATDGRDQTRYGVSERIQLSFGLGNFLLEAMLVVDQRNTSVWYNDYSTLEQVTYQLSENIGLGVNHALLGSFIDSSTGYSRGLQFFNERDSRFTAFVAISM